MGACTRTWGFDEMWCVAMAGHARGCIWLDVMCVGMWACMNVACMWACACMWPCVNACGHVGVHVGMHAVCMWASVCA